VYNASGTVFIVDDVQEVRKSLGRQPTIGRQFRILSWRELAIK
jgi:hypothetical protein